MSWFATWSGSPMQAAHALRVAAADLLEFFRRRVLRRDVLEREDVIDRPPIGTLDDRVMEIVLGLLLGRPASGDADRIDAEFPALLLGLIFGARNLLRRFVERGTGCLKEERVAVANGEGLSHRGRARIHDQRSRAAIGLGLAANALHAEIFSAEIEIFLVRPDHPDDIDPFLRVFIARFVVALFDAEHREFALVPAA